ncbi:MAG TPA: hypothetical protein VHZ95_08985, partial [Polyangiales bacterium]|nr:hypothetical protein [Polyangiales bacterium]
SSLNLRVLARFIADEHRCCPFLRFELSERSLNVHGQAGSRAVLEALLVAYGAIDQSASL